MPCECSGGAVRPEVEGAIAELVKELAKTYGTEREGEIAELWEKGWNAVRRRAPAPIVALDEPLTDALNDAAGKLADAALARLSKYRAGVGRLPSGTRARVLQRDHRGAKRTPRARDDCNEAALPATPSIRTG